MESFGKNDLGLYNSIVELLKSRILMILLSFWNILRPWGKALTIFVNRGGNTLSAAVAFYTLLSIIPFLLLLIRLMGVWIKDLALFKYHLFNLGKKFFPQVAPDLLNFAEKLVSAHLFASGKWTAFNIGILAFSAFSMFNAVLNGMHWLTQHEHKDTLSRYLKGFGLIVVTIGLMVFTLTIPALMKWTINVLTTNRLVEYATQLFPPLNDIQTWMQDFKIGRYFFFKSRFLSSIIFLIYFTFLYRWFFPVKVKLKYAFMAACTFVGLMISGRELFWVYLKFGKSGLVSNYGTNYTLILGIIWIFLLASFFFYGICLVQALLDKEIADIPNKDGTHD